MFKKLLIANRGEIACRIARTARRLGVSTVAVFSDADAGAPHVAACDEAVRIGPPPASASYLDIERIVRAAQASGADAIHPGYGFLSENAELALACERAGLVFVGPDPEAIRIMGSKSAAKALLASHDVPLVPGYYGEEQDPEALAAHAEAIGFPLLIKASAGGGGRGMRVVREASEFAALLASARREAQSAFGDPRVLLEKYVEAPRHVEVQIFGDRLGNCVHLFERDCSGQRRHQKVIEEAPAPGLDDAERRALYQAALNVGRAVRYVGAGTVEFVLDGHGGIHFIEMNTRLQVEHPVTELITGVDLVEWQLRVAAGEPLPLEQAAIACRGHAIEARVYAEEPVQNFKPSIGTIAHLRLPEGMEGLRIDAGVVRGSTVSPYYDAMVAKLIACGPDRAVALDRLALALERTELLGVGTNLRYLHAIVSHPRMRAGGVTTHFIDEERARLIGPDAPPTALTLALATAFELAALERASDAAAADRWSPWRVPSGFRLNGAHRMSHRFGSAHGSHETVVEIDGSERRIHVGDEVFRLPSAFAAADGEYRVVLGERHLRGIVVAAGSELHVRHAGGEWRLLPCDPLHGEDDEDTPSGSLTAPMPGVIAAVLVAVGDAVTRGTPLMVLEAMKIEHSIVASCDGVVREIRYAVGEQVTAEGAELVRIEAAE